MAGSYYFLQYIWSKRFSYLFANSHFHATKLWLEVALVSQITFQFVLFVLLKSQVVLPIGIEKIGEHLVAHHLIGNNKLGAAMIGTIDSDHAEIEEQTEEIVWVVDALGRKILVERTCDITLLLP